MAESVVSSLAQYLGGLLVQEAKFLSEVSDQIVKIQHDMMKMQCFLKDADAKQDESAVVRNLVSEVRELAYDVEDAIDTYILKTKYASSFNPKKYIRLQKIGKEINNLQSRIQDITPKIETYGFKRTVQGEGMSSATEIRQQLRQSYPHYDDEDVIGIDNDIKVLVAKLIKKEGPHLVSIAGMGGLGKTTLAKKVYNHDDVRHYFDCCAWSFISQQFQGRTILKEILRKVSNEKEVETLSDGELREKLYKVLQDKCYLVVLDDIWSEEAWDLLKPAFPKGKIGSKIMLTTRNKNVATYVDLSGFLHEPECLTEEQSWQLLRKKAFPWKNVTSSSSSSSSSFMYPPEVEKKEELGRAMIKKCGGLPLAVVVLGGLLLRKKSIREWEVVAKDIEKYRGLINKAQPYQHEQQLDVSWILSLSYQDLPYYLKPCFLYLSQYPEDAEFRKTELIRKWIAEGFVQQHNEEQGTRRGEEMGEEYLMELINRSMVQVSRRSSRGKVRKCRMHDLMRDICVRKAKEENFLCTFDDHGSSPVNSSFDHHQMRRLAVHFTFDSDRRDVSIEQASGQSTHLRTLICEDKSATLVEFKVLEFVCNKFSLLRVLQLEYIEIDRLPREIGKLIHLRYLGVSSYNKIKVPTTIGNLRSIQFLRLNGIETLPNVLWKMKQLSCFYCNNIRRGTHDNKRLRLDGLKNLSTLGIEWTEELMLQFSPSTLTNLQELELRGISGTELTYKESNEIPAASQLRRFLGNNLDRLQCLKLYFKNMGDNYNWSALSDCSCLWKLYLFQIKELPMPEDFPPNLTKLWLQSYNLKEDPIPILEKLPNLESLALLFTNITKSRFSAKAFGRLQYLRLHHLMELEELEVEEGALSCLVHLQIFSCDDLRMLPEGLRFLTALKKLEVINIPDIFKERLQEDGEDWHKIQHISSITIKDDSSI